MSEHLPTRQGRLHLSEDESDSQEGAEPLITEDESDPLARTEPLVQLWVLRILIRLRAFKKHFINGRHRYPDEDMLYALADIFDFDMERFKMSSENIHLEKVLRHLGVLYKNSEKTLKHAVAPEYLARNIKRLSKLAGLSVTDCRILEFAILLHTEQLFQQTCELLGDLTSIQTFHVLSAILDLPLTDVRKSLGKNGPLCRSGLLSFEGAMIGEYDYNVCIGELHGKLYPLSLKFADNMVSLDADPVILLLEDIIFPGTPPHLTISDYPHLARELNILLPYLKKSVKTGRKGVNILLHGEPGTGKSQLAKILATETGCELFEVASEDKDGEPRTGWARLRALQAAQNLLSNQNIMLLVDELEDVLDLSERVERSRNTFKAWFNQHLEGNTVPTLWLGNSIHGLDPALIRRFDMIIKMPVPPKKQRQKIIRETCSDILTERDIERISAAEPLAPAVVTRASSVVASLGDELAQQEQAPALELIINNTLEAQAHQRIQRYDPNRLPQTYDPALIHADTDTEDIATGLKNTKAGRLCLYGPSGTGKTAYGRWLAEQLEIPLLVKRGSDLISAYVGETEGNIAECFQQAEKEGALLMIDEVESFLQERRGAKRNWEVTEVNEMLTQMESFAGVFIASTNLRDNLDQAALRRFDLKIKFDYLLPHQSRTLLQSHCNTLELDTPDETLSARLSRLNNLTPGDFTAVTRRHRFKPVCSAAEMVSALEQECGLKENFKHPIGFC